MKKSPERLFAILLAVVFLAACSSPTPVPPTQPPLPPTVTPLPPTDTPLPTPTRTLTPLPPTDTPTLAPTSTLTPADTETPTPTVTLTAGPKPALVLLPGATEGTVKIYFILPNVNVNTCDDRIIAISSGIEEDGDVETDVAAGLRKLFSYHDDFYGDLYNPLYLSHLRVQKVDYSRGDHSMQVWISGTYKPTGNPCDNQRVRTQIWNTVRQFGGVDSTVIYLNKGLFWDRLGDH